MLLKSKMLQRLAGGFLERWGTNRICALQRFFLGTHKDRKIIKLMKRVRKEVGGPMTNEAFILMSLAHSQSQLLTLRLTLPPTQSSLLLLALT